MLDMDENVKGFLMEGYPRNIEQVTAFEDEVTITFISTIILLMLF